MLSAQPGARPDKTVGTKLFFERVEVLFSRQLTSHGERGCHSYLSLPNERTWFQLLLACAHQRTKACRTPSADAPFALSLPEQLQGVSRDTRDENIQMTIAQYELQHGAPQALCCYTSDTDSRCCCLTPHPPESPVQAHCCGAKAPLSNCQGLGFI